ncbi:MAG: hypothetical protein AAFQ27_06010 [Pseudomonadota bacterium]
MFALLLAIGLRTVLGAPCCMDGGVHAQASASNAEHQHHAAESDSHSEHGDTNSANPCCSACGPTLPSEPAQFAPVEIPGAVVESARFRALATRPPYPAYEATGPPFLT